MMHVDITDNTPDLKNYHLTLQTIHQTCYHLTHIPSCFHSVYYVKKLNNSQPL